jgi:hypothetical protein
MKVLLALVLLVVPAFENYMKDKLKERAAPQSPPAAEEVAARVSASISAFEKVCLTPAPGVPEDTKAFAELGYTESTTDKWVMRKPGGGDFAGLGAQASEGDTTGKLTRDGCLVAIKALSKEDVIGQVDAALQRRFKKVQKIPHGDDMYWGIYDFAPRTFTASVIPKVDGLFEAHLMVMFVEMANGQK